MLLAVIICIVCGFYGTPTVLASEYSETSVPVASKYNETSASEYSEYAENCDNIGYLPPNPNLTEAENRGRCTWYLWTGGNDKYYRDVAKRTRGEVDLLGLLDNSIVDRDKRFEEFGTVNDPGCEKATEPDEYGLLLDKCKDPESSGIIGLRKFKNPNFDPVKWDPKQYKQDSQIEPPYRIGQSCAICHVAFNPLKPPKDPVHPKWENLVPALGNQYIKENALFDAKLKPDDFRWQVLNTQKPGTSDTSRIATDHINNPNVVNSIFNLGDRPKHPEVMNDGSTQDVNHILKDGADSIGVAKASLRVYVNIGMCGDYWLSLHDAVLGRKPQRPFDIEKARKECQDWNNTEARMPDMEAFLKTIKPMHLAQAPGGEAFLTKDEQLLKRGKIVFAQSCATCHSSKQPSAEIAVDPEKAKQWYIESVLSSDFLDHNFLSDDKRYPVTLIGTNAGRALGTNATKGHIWEQFSSKTYKEQPSPGTLTLDNPLDKNKPIEFEVPSGGVGYYRTPSLISVWATAPYLHNNSLGKYNEDPSVEGRIDAYNDAMEKLLSPEKREGIISRTTQKSKLALSQQGIIKIPVPEGMPVDLLANINPREAVTDLNLVNLFKDLKPEGGLKGKLGRVLLRANKSPDFIEDKGHTFGSELSDEDKKALSEFVKTF
ncbi:MAG: hypothetical protein KME46_31255 [Brasilonema angustatum HA4187-MV1]|nr:hypothetical protein [Brasilonema angustatum HA4187-MV1]